VKETTLDYTSDFAERRGLSERMGVRSEIKIPGEREAQTLGREAVPVSLGIGGFGGDRDQAHDDVSTAKLAQDAGEHKRDGAYRDVSLARGSSQKVGEELAQDFRAEPREDLAQDRGDGRQQRRSRFEGLKLSRSASADRPAAQDRDDLRQERPEKAKRRRSRFDGLKLNARPGPSQERADGPEREGSLRPAPAQDRLAERLRPQSALEQAVDRYARAYESAHRQQREGLPILDAQRQDLRQAGHELDQARLGARELMRSALRYDPDMQRSMTELSGRERVGQVIERLDHERAVQSDPNVRADRFVERWQALQEQRQQLRGWQNDEARGTVEGQMQGLAKSLERDPQVESVLRNRRQELGIGQHMRQSEGIVHELQHSLTRGRSLGLER
jgi:hypothetical protein